MIHSKSDYKYYLYLDRVALGIELKLNLKQKIVHLLSPNLVWKFQKQLRKLEYYSNTKTGWIYGIRRRVLALRFNRLSARLGFSIPINVFGPGLSIAHYGTIVVNPHAVVGDNCRIHPGVCIGTEAGYSNKAPNIGNNCYIAPGVKVFGDIYISSGTAIGANAVVNKSFSEANIFIAGIPATKISKTNTKKYLLADYVYS